MLEIKNHLYGKRQYIPRDQVIPLVVDYCILIILYKSKSLQACFIYKNQLGLLYVLIS